MVQQNYESFKAGMRERNLVFDSGPIPLTPYDFHLHQGYGKSKTGIEWDDVVYRNVLRIIRENEFYGNSDGIILLSFDDRDVETISKIASVLYASGDIEKKVIILMGFFRTHRTLIQQDFRDYMRGDQSIESLQKKLHNTFIDNLTELFMTTEHIFEEVFKYVFQDLKMPPNTRKIILELLFGEQSRRKDNIDKYDRAIKRFKYSIINTIKLKLAHHEDDMDTTGMTYTPQSTQPFVMPENPTKLECLIIADAIATALTIDPILQVKSHKMHPRAHLAFKGLGQTLKPTIEDFIQKHISLSQCIEEIFHVIEGELNMSHCNAKQIKLLWELVTGYLHGLEKNGKFKFEKCNRYPNDSGNGVKVIASRLLNKGEEVDNLSGQVAKILEQDRVQNYHKNEFSIMLNGKNEEVVFLGPGSFLNHDCNPNAQYVPRESRKIAIQVIRETKEGEEINVFYRKDYFGEGNNDCKCRTCEYNLKGAFSRERYFSRANL